jgi:oligosaccharyltransferase complex subunit beta
MRSLVCVLLAALWATCACALSAAGSRLLVVLDDVDDTKPYSHFFGDLEGRGYQITYETPKSESVALFHLGQRTYDHVVFFPTKVKGLGPNLTPQILLQFVNAKGNILLAQSSTKAAPSSLVSFLAELDIAFPQDRSGLVVDHFSYDAKSAAEAHDVVLLAPQKPVRAGIKAYFSPEDDKEAVLAYPHGMGHALGPSTLLTPVLRAPRTAYLYDPKEQADKIEHDELFASGTQLGLVSVFQARNSGRVAVVGAVEMLADEWFDADVETVEGKTSRTWNREFAKRLSGWTFHEIGVLRVNSVDHYLMEQDGNNVSNPEIYRIKTDSKYTVSLSEYAWDKWTPFVVPEEDQLQLEFSMLSPYQRLNLAPIETTNNHETTYTTTFRLPDQHGIFNFMLNYKRPLLTNVEEKRTVSVRHMAHDEWPRSFVISGAWPWISGVGVTMVGFLAFCIVWMFSQPVQTATVGKKSQ